jgi:hypothetical protein
MATYDYEKVMADYTNGRMDAEMAVGHALQHIGNLYATQTTASTEQRAWQQRVAALETAVARLQKTQTDRLRSLGDSLVALQHALAAWQADTDSLPAPKPESPRAKSR